MYTTQTGARADRLLKSHDTRLHDEWQPRSSSGGGGDGQTFTLRGCGRGEENAAPKKKSTVSRSRRLLWYLYPYRIYSYIIVKYWWCDSDVHLAAAIPNVTTLSTPQNFCFSRWHHQSSRSAARCREFRLSAATANP